MKEKMFTYLKDAIIAFLYYNFLMLQNQVFKQESNRLLNTLNGPCSYLLDRR